MKKEKHIFYPTLILCLISISYVLYNRLWFIAVILISVVSLYNYLLVSQRKKIEKSLYHLSDVLDQVYARKDLAAPLPAEDTIFSKIDHQVFQLNNLINYIEGNLTQEHMKVKMQIAEISHQLRTPLFNLNIYLELSDDPTISDQERNNYFLSMKDATKDITFLIEHFILSSRLESEIIQIKKTPTNIKVFLAGTISRGLQLAQKKNITIRLEESSELQNTIFVDSNWLEEALGNILENSIKYSPEDSEIIILIDGNDLFTKISVKDHGIGIEPGKENLILQRYYRGTNVANIPGHGLGLYISNEILKKHGGFIKVKNKDSGLTITLYLPKTN